MTTMSVCADESELTRPSLCKIPLNIPSRPVVEDKLKIGDLHLAADNADIETEGISTLSGNVEIALDGRQARSDQAQFNQTDNTADLAGNVQYWDESVHLEADTAHIDFNTDTVQADNTKYIIKDDWGHGESTDLERKIGIETKLKNANYSTCEPENEFWSVSADEMKFDHVEGWGKAKNVMLRIKNVPVFYSPYLSFPLEDKRKTGFLTPVFGETNKNGFQARTPFYWNIAPHMDATLTPRLLTKRGFLLIGEFRHKSKKTKSQLNAEVLLHDNKPGDNEFSDKNRSLVRLKHQYKFAKKGKFSLDYNRVSDRRYFNNFGSSINISGKRFLRQRGEISYAGSWWDARVRLNNYQTVQTNANVNRPYKQLPQIKFNAHSSDDNNKLNYSLDADFTYFDREDRDSITAMNVTGARLNLIPSIRYPYKTTSTFLTAKLDLRYTQYKLNKKGTFESSPGRLLPVVSIDSGIFLERDLSLFGTQSLQTLEPRIFYLYVPDKNQDDLPVFDTGLRGFSFGALFREDRFNGYDRLGDANQFSLAVISRLIDHDTGKERGRVSLGQIYYLGNRDVVLPRRRILDDDSSPLVARISAKIFDHLKLQGNLQWEPNSSTTEKLVVQAQYKPAKNKIINFKYRVSDTSRRSISLSNVEQSDFSFHWPLNQNWSMVGRWNYAIPEDKTLLIFGGIEYNSCCWGFRVVGQKFLKGLNKDFETGVFLQLELKGLVGAGRKTANFLKRKIRGYEGNLLNETSF